MDELETRLTHLGAVVNQPKRDGRHEEIKSEVRAFSVWARANLTMKPKEVFVHWAWSRRLRGVLGIGRNGR